MIIAGALSVERDEISRPQQSYSTKASLIVTTLQWLERERDREEPS
jgi:hypothetical protein